MAVQVSGYATSKMLTDKDQLNAAVGTETPD